MPQRQPFDRLASIHFVFTTTLLLTVSGSSRAQDPTSIPWRPTFEQALAEAQARQQPLWIQFTGPWCGYCRQMEATTFRSGPVVAAARGGFVAVMVRNDLREDLAYHYNVSAVPTTVVIAPGGEILGRHTGYLESGTFLGLLESSRARFRPVPTAAETLALAGNDPVHLVRTGELTGGRPDIRWTYDDSVYQFASEEAREAFRREPERYVPSNGGHCVVGTVDDGKSIAGDARFGVYYHGRLYLCASEEARRRFAREPRRYADADLGLNGYCPHCRNLSGRDVKGLPRYSVTHDGRRYLFPTESHREAFREDPSRYLR
jgi:YHS domain-containing protein/thioredoxin-related protein